MGGLFTDHPALYPAINRCAAKLYPMLDTAGGSANQCAGSLDIGRVHGTLIANFAGTVIQHIDAGREIRQPAPVHCKIAFDDFDVMPN